jgi:hypothetical protein
MADDETEGLDNKIVKALEKEVHLLRCDVRAGARWYEITHDRLIAPIRQSNHDWTVARWKKLIRRGIVAAILAIPVSIYVYYLVDSARHTRIQQAERVVTKETKTQTTQELLVTAVKSRWDSDVAEGTAKALGDFLANSSYDFDARRKDLSDKVAQLAGTDRLQACETIHFVLSFFPRPAEGSVTLPNTTAAVRTLHRSVITPATTNVKDFAALHDYLCAHNAAVIVATVERKAMEDEQFNKVVADEVARWKRYGFADAIAARPTRRGAVQIAADYFLDMDEARDLMNTLKTKQISPYVVPCFVGIKNCDQKINTPIREYSLFDIPETK